MFVQTYGEYSPYGVAMKQARPEIHPWYALQTRSRHEKKTATILTNKGYAPYLPTYRSRRRWSDRVVEAESILFPGYLFCRFDARRRFPIETTPGVVSVISFGVEPVAIADEEIQAIENILASGLLAEPYPFLREGQPVRITRGALEGLSGLLVKIKNHWRLVVSVSLLQRSVAVEIDRDWVTNA
jgi:transcription antitermination factor NusG